MRHEVCGACKFWQQREESTENGECRRHPPTVHMVISIRPVMNVPEPRPISAFPPTHATSWCGEFADDFGSQAADE